ncbi:MAG: hypothetical protein ACJATT_003846 [Myxococcota bacterium]|jgi:hypothetical protein
MRVALVALAFAACTPWTEFPDVEGPGDVVAASPGAYSGTATLEVRAFAGPVMVKRELCTTPVDIVVDTTAEFLLAGEFECTFEELGDVDAEFRGNSNTLPLIAGELDAEPVLAEWDGWFIDSTEFYAELIGNDTARGLRIEYRGFIQATRTGPLAGSSVGP